MVVLGPVAQVNESEDGQTLFLNFGGRYPYHVFNAVVLRRNLKSFPEARSWEGKVIRVCGKMQLYKGGKPEIILERPEQVAIESSVALPESAAPTGSGGPVEQDVLCPDPSEAPVGMPVEAGAIHDFDSPPQVIKTARPQYPQDAFVNKIEGTVLIEALVDAQGRVARARVIQSVAMLDAAALHACCQWVFKPAMKHGRPVATIIHMPVAFRIYGKEEQRKQRADKVPPTK